MTEADAKTKWCPFARTKTTAFGIDNAGPAGINRDFDGEPVDRLHTCLASACMAWRVQEAPRETLRNYHAERAVEPKPGLGGRVFPDGWQYSHTDTDRNGRKFDLLHRIAADTDRFGYCGLAGALQS